MLSAAAALIACGDDAEPSHDAEEVASCITGSGTLLTDPLSERPVRFDLSPALRERAGGKPRVGEGSVLPRPTAFAAFAGFDSTFVPADLDAATFVPAAFLFFPDATAAQAHEQEADLRRGNLLIVFHGDPPQAELNLIEECL